MSSPGSAGSAATERSVRRAPLRHRPITIGYEGGVATRVAAATVVLSRHSRRGPVPACPRIRCVLPCSGEGGTAREGPEEHASAERSAARAGHGRSSLWWQRGRRRHRGRRGGRGQLQRHHHRQRHRAAEQAAPRQHERDRRRTHHGRAVRGPGPVRRERRPGQRCRGVHRDRGLEDLHDHDQGRPDLQRRQPPDGEVLRGRLELRRQHRERPAELLLLRADRGLRGRAPGPGRGGCRGRAGAGADGGDHVGSEGRRRHDVRGRARPAAVRLPDPPGLHGVHAAARVRLRGSGRVRGEAHRQRAVHDGGRVGARRPDQDRREPRVHG